MLTIFSINSTRSKNGFTIIEIILAIGALGLLSTIAINSFNRQLRNSQLNKATQTIVNFIRSSQSISLNSASPCKIIISQEDAQVSISNAFECSSIGNLKLLEDLSEKNTVKAKENIEEISLYLNIIVMKS